MGSVKPVDLGMTTEIVGKQVYEGLTALVAGYLKSRKMSHFESLEDVSDQVSFLFSEEAHFPMIQGIKRSNRESDEPGKSKTFSKAMRDAGNKAFGVENDADALDCYNQAVMSAPCDVMTGTGEDLAIGLANRAAVFLRQEKYQFCLADVILADQCGYPDHLKYKLYQRHAKCLCEIFRFKEAELVFEKAKKALEDSRLGKDQRAQVLKEIKGATDAIKLKHGLEKALNAFVKDPNEAVPEEMKIFAPKLPQPNPHYPCLSASATVSYDTFQGRHVIATEDIKPGEVIALEKPIVHFLYSNTLLSNCTQCVKAVVVPVPCFGCAAVVFCSAKCRDTAWILYHRFECCAIEGITSVYQNLFIVYRLIVQNPLSYYQENEAKFKKAPASRGAEFQRKAAVKDIDDDSDSEDESSNDEGEGDSKSPSDRSKRNIPNYERIIESSGGASFVYNSDDFENAFHLQSQKASAQSGLSASDQEARSKLSLASATSLLMFYLRQSGFFGYKKDSRDKEPLNEDERLIARLVHHLLDVSQFNTHQISEIGHWDMTEGVQVRPVGCVINPTLALFNHSCSPNTIRVNIGTQTLVVATKHIHRGHEIHDSYSVQYQDVPYMQRQTHLRDYYRFECRCQACLGDWPVYQLLKKTVARAGVTTEKVEEVKKMFMSLTKLCQQDLKSGFFDRIVEMWSGFSESLEKTLLPPHKCYLRVAYQIFDCFWLKYGNKVPKLKAPIYKDHVLDAKLKKEDKE